jgi:hypothetical protein
MEDVKAIFEIFTEAKKYGLEAEVVWSALESMKSNPTQTTVEAMMDGLNEWVK